MVAPGRRSTPVLAGEPVSRDDHRCPAIDANAQPYYIETEFGPVLELPIAAISDYTPTGDLVDILDHARDRLARAPDKDVFVILGFHQETAHEFASRVSDALRQLRTRNLADANVMFTTIDRAAALARHELAP